MNMNTRERIKEYKYTRERIIGARVIIFKLLPSTIYKTKKYLFWILYFTLSKKFFKQIKKSCHPIRK